MTCQDCRNAYQGADLVLRCRVNGLKASERLFLDCKRFEREPGADSEEIEVVLCSGCDSQCHRYPVG